MKIKLNLLSFLLPLFEMETGEGGGGVASTSPDAVSMDTASSPDVLAESGSEQSQPSVTGSEQPTDAVSDDPLKDIPTLEELQAQVAQKVPHAQALAQLRPAYESAKEQLGQFESWKPLVEKQIDPAVALANHELVSLLHSSDPNSTNPDDFSTVPFLQKAEADSPGVVDQMYKDMAQFTVERDGVVDTVLRHQVRAWGLNPDNIGQYKALENGTLNVASGIVNSEELAKIDPQYHDAFKALSPSNRADILALLRPDGNETDRLNATENLRNAHEALEAKKFREQIQQREESDRQAQQQRLEQEIQTESQTAIDQATSEIYSSIQKSLASQVKISSDELVNESHQVGVLSNLYTLLDPAGRKLILEPLLAKMGVSLDSTIAGVQVPFDQTVNRFTERLAAAKRFEKYGDQMRARQALSEASQARQLLTAKLNQIALKLAQPTAQAVAGNGNVGATARTVPNGNQASQNGNHNPYDDNPHRFGTPEYAQWNRNLDRQLGVSGTAAFSN